MSALTMEEEDGKIQADAERALLDLEKQHAEHPGPARVVAPASGPITTTAQINADNARYWATPGANATQKVVAELQSKTAVIEGQQTVKRALDKKRTKNATAGKVRKGQESLKLASDAMGKYQARGISKGRAADFIANDQGKKSSAHTARQLKKAGYKTR